MHLRLPSLLSALCLLLWGATTAAAQEDDVLLWSSTGGGWRAMFADVGYANLFKQAGLMTPTSTRFSGIVSRFEQPWDPGGDRSESPQLPNLESKPFFFPDLITSGHRVGRVVVFNAALLFVGVLQSNRPRGNSRTAGGICHPVDGNLLQHQHQCGT